jgi:biotin synthase
MITSAKSGRCAENCAFCAQSAHHRTDAPVFPLKSPATIVDEAKRAQDAGARCFGIVTSGTRLTAADRTATLEAIQRIRQQTAIIPSASVGLLTADDATALAQAGCGTYHHNLETARSFFPQICTTHDYEEDVQTVRCAKAAGMKVCSGGIFGLGETDAQRVELAMTLRELEVDSVPVNFLNPVPGTRLEQQPRLQPLTALRLLAMLRHLLPTTRISVCGGREATLREYQSWMFLAGANGMMVGNYLTTSGRDLQQDLQLLADGGYSRE